MIQRNRVFGEADVSAAQTVGGGQASDGNKPNFDTNMVIILAALLCALIGALGVNTIVRCALRCRRRLEMETPEAAAARLAATGLKKRDLRQIPVAVYGGGVKISINETECPICLGEYKEGERIRVLPKCNHGFHVSCIDTWLASHSSCPNCRHSLLRPDQSITPNSCSQPSASPANRSPGLGSVVIVVD